MQDINLKQHQNTNRLSHAYIVSPALADTLSVAAVCSASTGVKPCMECPQCSKASRGIHPDITVVTKARDSRIISVDQIRQLRKAAFVIPNDAAKSVYIIRDAELMNPQAQNAFLQLLEEPPSHVVFILSTQTPSALLKTVRSRCVELNSLPEPEEINSAAQDIAAEFFSALERDNYELISFMFKLEKLERQSLISFLSAARNHAADRLRAADAGASATGRKTLAQAESILSIVDEYLNFNVSAGHISGLICATLLEIEN